MMRLSLVILIIGILLGLGLGVLIGWVIYPVEYVDTVPAILRADYKDEYLLLIASAYAADHNLERAQQRLDALGYPDSAQAVDTLAQRLANEGKDSSVLAIFATALRADQAVLPSGWKRFEGTGYSMAIPTQWFAYRGLSDVPAEVSGILYDMILSDVPSEQSPQYSTDAQQVRLTISYIPKPNETLEVWAVRHWSWLNTELAPTTVGDGPGLVSSLNSQSSAVFQKYFWIEQHGRYYVIEIYSNTDDQEKLRQLQDVIASLTFQ